MTDTLALMGGTLKILNLSEILAAYFEHIVVSDRCSNKYMYCIFSRVQGAIEN